MGTIRPSLRLSPGLGVGRATVDRSRQAPLLLLACSSLALLAAYGSERLGGLVPCALCLRERWPWWAIFALGLLALMLPRARRSLLWLALLAGLAALGLGIVHVGVEWGAWPSPLPECAAPRLAHGSLAARFASMPLRPSKPCDEPTYLVAMLPLSMAQLQALAALAFSAAVAISLRRRNTGTPR